MEKKKFLYLMTKLVMAFKEDFGKERGDLYYEFLGNEDPILLNSVIDEIIRDKQWFPKISEILELIHPKPKEVDLSYWPSFNDRPMIEHQEPFNKEEAKAFLGEISNHIKDKERKEVEDRQKGFEERKKMLQEQKKKIMEGLN